MRVLIFHGYLLQGTGSNVYNANLAGALVRAGHEVHLFCQDRAPLDLPWADAAGNWDGGQLRVQARRAHARATVYRPDIAGLLPVYVADRYEGVQAKTFPELSEAELARYLRSNVDAVREIAEATRPDVALANHLVMGPSILARALADLEVPYAVKIHGSALEYTVKPHPRFLPYAREGLASAAGVLVGSRHTAKSLWAAMGDPSLEGRTGLGPPGVDVARFTPRSEGPASEGVDALRARLRAAAIAGGAPQPAEGAIPTEDGGLGTGDSEKVMAEVVASSFTRDHAEAADALARLDVQRDRPVIYIGKLIGSKGVELLLAAWPLVRAAVPEAKLLIVGFGGFKAGLQALAQALSAGDLAAAASMRSEEEAELPWLSAFLAQLDGGARDQYVAAAAGMEQTLLWTGRLDHDDLHDLLPAMEAMVVPSTFPESFGMVAAEAAACGVLPVVARHSGLAEVAETLSSVVPDDVAALLTFSIGPDAVRELAQALSGWLTTSGQARRATRQAMVDVTRARYSWDGVARTVIAAACGELDALAKS